MRFLINLGPAVALLACSATALSIQARDDRNRAAYFLNNDPNGNSLITLKISVDDGTLSDPTSIPTGGNGLLGLGAGGVPGGADGLFSQDAVHVSEDYLFVVNPGSKTLSMFLIDDNDPWHPTLVGKPADTLGDFPMSVSYSSQIKTACVLNGGAVGGVTCFSADHAKGLTVLDQAPRNVSKALHETTPPAGPPGTASDIVFNPSGTALFATIKGNPGPPAVPGFIYAWPVNLGKVSTEAVINSLPDVILDFSMNFLGSDGRLIITDPSFGASIVNVSPKLTISEDKHVAIPNQGAACWSAYASRFNSAYVIDAGHPNITIVNPASGAIKGVINYNATAKGGFDTAIDRTFMYTLASTPSIVVINLMGSDSGKTPTQLQLLDLSSLGSRQGWQGMAVYPS